MHACTWILQVYENNNSQVYTVNPDLSEGNYLLTDLQPTTDYVLAICISNGVMENNMQFFITTAIGMWVCAASWHIDGHAWAQLFHSESHYFLVKSQRSHC